MSIAAKRFVLIFILGLIFTTSYQNCGNTMGFTALQVIQRDLSSVTLPGPNPGGGSITDEEGFIFPQDALGTIYSSYDDCRNHDSEIDACIFLKNPAYSQGGPFPLAAGEVISYQTNLSAAQSFGVPLKNLDGSGTLTSTRGLAVYYTGADSSRSPFENNNPFRLTLNGSKKFQAYQNDGVANSTNGNEKVTAQLMAYVWIQYLVDELGRRTGINRLDNMPIMVDAYTTDPAYGGLEKKNAFYQGYTQQGSTRAAAHEIVMGYATNSAGANRHEMALSAEVYIHEMGHANLFQAVGTEVYMDTTNSKYEVVITTCTNAASTYANTRRILDDDQLNTLAGICGSGASFRYSIINSFCKTNMGCIDAINEGQADFHYIMVFPNAPQLGETFTNSLAGLSSPKLYLPGSPGGSSCGAEDTSKPVVQRDASAPVPGAGRAQDYYVGSALQYNVSSPNGVIRCGMDVPGEVHGMGSLYAKILFDIYSQTDHKRAFERTFQRTLTAYTRSATFSTIRSLLTADDIGLENGVNLRIINQVFDGKGIP